ncbi:hypothetical protein M5K25_013767 [Dendrobium thyrsiflorum]|uniref:F-box domain-containing protein n=1 Tax=Dendrobium thyrsiflorum TaxID=117978 RepID=A0ABD0V0P9_DENTH
MDTSPEMEGRRHKMQRSAAAGGSGEVSPTTSRAADGDEWRYWEGLNHELLALIFTRIPADELVRTVPLVCRGWREAVVGPYCWSDIHIEDWCRRVDRPHVIDFAVRKLVRRSRHSLRRLCAYRIGNWGFSLTAHFGNHLSVLQIPMSEINDLTIQKSSGSLTALAVLDISYCKNITSKGIETLGKNCRSLVNLRRNMTPPEYESTQDNGVAAKINEDEALAIANTMLGIEQLELAYGRFSDHGLDAILSNCRALSSLDINGCWNVKLDGDVGIKCDSLKRGVDNDKWRYWEGLNHEVLALIFKKIPADEMARTVPFVCKSWQEAVAGPCCWSEIDIEDWCRRVDNPDVIDAVVRKLVRRSRYTLRRLSAYRIQNWGFSLTASFGMNLNVLEIPMSEVDDSALQKYSGSLTSLTILDISYCKQITCKGIEILGKNCTSLISLKRNLTPPEFESTQNNEGEAKVYEREALAIANTMLGLEQLELAYGRFSDYGLDAILSNCKALSFLDLSGCQYVKLKGNVGSKFYALNLHM